jgi:lycopene cyclase domain-containing protein
VWDVLFVNAGIWHFNPDYVLGAHLAGLPIEEILFFLCIPYACVFTYFCMKPLEKLNSIKAGKVAATGVIAVCTLLSVLYYDRLYTLTTCVLLGIALIVLLRLRVVYLYRMIAAYIAVIPFFILSNGILTGMLTDAPVVIYNDAENCGIRLLTIPLEDIFYGMLLVVLNVAGYEWFRARNRKEQRTLQV